MVSIAAIIQHNTSAFSSLKGSGITNAKDFEGKKYASYGLPLERAVIEGMMDCEDGDIGKVEFVDIGFDALPALLGGRVDFAWTFLAWDAMQARDHGISAGQHHVGGKLRARLLHTGTDLRRHDSRRTGRTR